MTALDISAHALIRAEENFRRNGFTNGSFVEANAFEYLKATERERVRFDTIVLDPPAFAPGIYAGFARTWLAEGSQIVGGCCATGPEHIAAVAPLVEDKRHQTSHA